MNDSAEPMKLIVTIVERGQGSLIRQAYLSPTYQLRCLWQLVGRGTASSELLDILGIGTPERDVVFALASGRSAHNLFRKLKGGLGGNIHAKGILFSLPLSAVNGLMAAALNHLETLNSEIGDTPMEPAHHSLILALVNQGYTDAVMATAKAAGARGGTVLRARWAGDDEVHDIMGITVQSEKELLAIVATHKDRSAIMDAINEKHGLKSSPQAVLCSVGIENLARLG